MSLPDTVRRLWRRKAHRGLEVGAPLRQLRLRLQQLLGLGGRLLRRRREADLHPLREARDGRAPKLLLRARTPRRSAVIETGAGAAPVARQHYSPAPTSLPLSCNCTFQRRSHTARGTAAKRLAAHQSAQHMPCMVPWQQTWRSSAVPLPGSCPRSSGSAACCAASGCRCRCTANRGELSLIDGGWRMILERASNLPDRLVAAHSRHAVCAASQLLRVGSPEAHEWLKSCTEKHSATALSCICFKFKHRRACFASCASICRCCASSCELLMMPLQREAPSGSAAEAAAEDALPRPALL